MNALLDFLDGLRERPLGTIVLVGAGDGTTLDLERYAKLAPKQLLLIEGDPEASTSLERHAGHLQWVRIDQRAVAPQTGPVQWGSYSLASFNGLADAAPLQRYYPRLRAVEMREVQAIGAAELLGDVATAGVNVLALDVPGQEDALIAALDPDLLARFDIVALRGCRELGADAALRRLMQGVFERKVDDRTEPLWPVAVLRFDPLRHKTAQLEQQLAAARKLLHKREARIAEIEAARRAELDVARDAERRSAEQLQQIKQLTRSRASDAQLLAERATRIDALERRLEPLQTALADRTAGAESALAELAALQGELAVARPALDALESAQRKGRDADERLRDTLQRLADSQARVRQLESQQAREGARQTLLQDELQRAEGQIELIKGLLLGDSGI